MLCLNPYNLLHTLFLSLSHTAMSSDMCDTQVESDSSVAVKREPGSKKRSRVRAVTDPYESPSSSDSSSGSDSEVEERPRRGRPRKDSYKRQRLAPKSRTRRPVDAIPGARTNTAAASSSFDPAPTTADASAEEPPGENFVPYQPDNVNWDLFQENPNDLPRKNFCVECHVAQSAQQKELGKEYAHWINEGRNHRSAMKPMQWARMQQRQYNLNIRPKLRDKHGRKFTLADGKTTDKRGGPACSGRMLWEHSIEHVFEPEALKIDLIRVSMLTLRVFYRDMLEMGEQSGTIRVKNPRNMVLAAKYYKEHKLLWDVATPLARNQVYGY